MATQAQSFTDDLYARYQDSNASLFSIDEPQGSRYLIPSIETRQDVMRTAAVDEVGNMRQYETEEEGDETVADTDSALAADQEQEQEQEQEWEDTSSSYPSSDENPQSYDNINELLAENAPSLLPSANIIKNLFADTYAKGLRTSQGTANQGGQQLLTSQVPERQPTVFRNTSASRADNNVPPRGSFLHSLPRAGAIRPPGPEGIAPARSNLAQPRPEARRATPLRLDLIVPASSSSYSISRFPEAEATHPLLPQRVKPGRGNFTHPRPPGQRRAVGPINLDIIVPPSSYSTSFDTEARAIHPPGRGNFTHPRPHTRTASHLSLQPITPARGSFTNRLLQAGNTRPPQTDLATTARGTFTHRSPQTNTASPSSLDLDAPARRSFTTTHHHPSQPGNATRPPRPQLIAPARGNFTHRRPQTINLPSTPPAQTKQTDSGYIADTEYVTDSDDYSSHMTEPDTALDEIATRTHAHQPQTPTMPQAEKMEAQAAGPSTSTGQGSGGGAAAAASTAVRQDLLDMLYDPNLPSEVYKRRFVEFLRILKRDEEELKHVKDRKKARDMELQVLLLRTDIEKQRWLLKAQLAYEEATDCEELVTLKDTRPYATPGSDGRYGYLPRPSTIMMKTAMKLGEEMEGLRAEMEGKSGVKVDSEGMAAKALRMEDLQFFQDEFLEYYRSDREKEVEVRRQREEYERANPPKLASPVVYPTPMVHDTPSKLVSPPGTRVQVPSAARAGTDTPTSSTQQLSGSDALLRDNSGRRRPCLLPRRGAYQTESSLAEGDVPSEPEASMYTED